MPTTSDDEQECTDAQLEQLRQLPGLHLDSGTPCGCDVAAITTSRRHGFSDSLIFTHRCRECGNEFTTWIEG